MHFIYLLVRFGAVREATGKVSLQREHVGSYEELVSPTISIARKPSSIRAQICDEPVMLLQLAVDSTCSTAPSFAI